MSTPDPRNTDAALVVVFKNHAVKNEALSRTEGRPVFEDMEICEIRAPGSRNSSPQPALSLWPHWIDDPLTGEQHQITYAERFSRQYRQFKEQEAQTIAGTPLAHVSFLTEASRATMRALNVYTLEQLAGIDGQELKNLGPGGRDLKNQAIAYIEESKAKVPDIAMKEELEALRARNAVLEDDNEALQRRQAGEGQFKDMTDEQIVAFITTHSGGIAPTGNLSRKVLVRMATDARPSKAA